MFNRVLIRAPHLLEVRLKVLNQNKSGFLFLFCFFYYQIHFTGNVNVSIVFQMSVKMVIFRQINLKTG